MPKLPEIIWCESLDSTNNEVRRRLDGLDNLSVVAARSQTAGRGQGDHIWTSAPGENLTFTMLVRYSPARPLRARDAVRINDAVSSALLEFLSAYGIQAWVKPPNDIWVGELKICGLLIENILRGKDVALTILGVGLNVNQTEFPDFLPNPVSMAMLTGRRYELEPTLKRLREALVSHLRDLLP